MTGESYERRSFRDHMDVLLDGGAPDARELEAVYAEIAAGAARLVLPDTAAVLPLVRSVVMAESGPQQYRQDLNSRLNWWQHGLYMAALLLDLVPPADAGLDTMLSAALCHVLREILILEDPAQELPALFPVGPKIWPAVLLVTGDSGHSEAEQKAYYAALLSSREALLVKLAGRGDVVRRLDRLPLEESLRYARETRKYFLPLCVEAEDRYPELAGVISVLRDKLRCLVDVADIMDLRFAGREKDLEAEILELRQDNVRMKRMLSRMEGNS